MELKPIDYQMYYQQRYKKLPNVAFWATAITYWLAGLVLLIYWIAADSEPGIGFLCLLAGGVLGVAFGYLNRIWVATAISPKVVMADSLLEINKQSGGATTATEKKDDLPEL